MGSDVISLTAALLSDEYHHSRNLREKTARGSRLAVSQQWRIQGGGGGGRGASPPPPPGPHTHTHTGHKKKCTVEPACIGCSDTEKS